MLYKVTPSALLRVFTQFQPVSKATKVALAALGLFVLGLAVISYLHKRMVTDGTRSEGSDRRNGVGPRVVTDGTRLGGSDRRNGVGPRVGSNGFPDEANGYFEEGAPALNRLIRELGKKIRPEYPAPNVTPEAILNGIHACMARVSPLKGIVPGSDRLGNKFIYVTYGRIGQQQNHPHIVVFSMKQSNGEIDWYIGTIGPSSSKPPVIKPFFGEEAAHTKDLLKSLIRGTNQEYMPVETTFPEERGFVSVVDSRLNPYAILTPQGVNRLPELLISEGTEGATLEERVDTALKHTSPLYPIMRGVDRQKAQCTVFIDFTVFIYTKRYEYDPKHILIYYTGNVWKACYSPDSIKSQNLEHVLRELVANTHPALKLIGHPARLRQ